MMKKYLSYVLISALAILMLCGFNFAADAKAGVYVYDDGDYIPASEEAQIQSAIEEVRDKAKTDILVVFTGNPSTGNNRADAESIVNAWVNGGRGYGDKHNTVLLYVNMDENNGRGVFIDEYVSDEKFRLKDAEIDAILDGPVYDCLANGSYGRAAYEFVSEAADYAKPGFFETIWSWLLVGLGGGGIATGVGKGRHNAKSKVSKRHYLEAKSMTMSRVNDTFAGTTTVAHKIQQNTTPSGPSGRPSGGGNNIPSSAGSAGHHGGGKTF